MSSSSESSDDVDAFVDAVRAGDDAALTRLLQQYEPRLRTAARVLLGPWLRPHLDSLDLVQSVHRELLPGLRQGKYDLATPQQLLGLALTVIRRKVAHNWRRLHREANRDALPPNADEPTEPQFASRNSSDDPAVNALVNDAVAHILSGLNVEDRQVIERRLQGYSTIEIAAELGCDPHLLRARLSRLRQRLRSRGCDDWV